METCKFFLLSCTSTYREIYIMSPYSTHFYSTQYNVMVNGLFTIIHIQSTSETSEKHALPTSNWEVLQYRGQLDYCLCELALVTLNYLHNKLRLVVSIPKG